MNGAAMNRAFLYDWECRHVHHRTGEDIAFWLEVVASAPPGPCLELACGTGRVTWPLARAGNDMVGLDHDPEMLAVADASETPHPGHHPERHPRPRFVAADMCRFAFARSFAAIIIPYNSLQLLTSDDNIIACLTTAAAHLDPPGLLGLEVTDFQMGASVVDVPTQLIHADDGLSLAGSLHHDFVRRISRYHRRFIRDGDGATAEDDIVLRSLRPDELAPLLAAAGLVARQWWVDPPVTRAVAGRPCF